MGIRQKDVGVLRFSFISGYDWSNIFTCDCMMIADAYELVITSAF